MTRKKKDEFIVNPNDVVITQSEPSVKQAIQPVSVQPYATPKEPDVYVPDGYVHLVALDEDGNEKPASGFNIAEADYYKYYITPKFLLKKKGNK